VPLPLQKEPRHRQWDRNRRLEEEWFRRKRLELAVWRRSLLPQPRQAQQGRWYLALALAAVGLPRVLEGKQRRLQQRKEKEREKEMKTGGCCTNFHRQRMGP
jgi:hypothetical protein